MKIVSFVIPCYNSEKFIQNTVEDLQNAINRDFSEYKAEIILINDSSKDKTESKIEEIAKHSTNVIAIDMAKNFGQHGAIFAGLAQAKGDIVICLDDDGQTPPDEAIKLVNALDENTDVVYARYKNKKHNKFRNFGSKVNDYMAQSLLEKPKDLFISSYFAMKKYVKDEILKYTNPYPYLEGLVLRTTNKIKNVDINHKERKVGKSNYTLRKLLHLWVNGFTSFSVKPLRIAIVCSFIFVISAIIITSAIIINKIKNPSVPLGWSSTMVVLLIVGSALTFILGLIGEYVGRIYISINNSPQYVVRKVTKNDETKD